MRANIIPSVPFKNYSEIEELAMKAKGEVKRIQIDVCDGEFVPSISWPFTEYSKTDFEKFGKRDDFDVYLPFWENINYSVDMMVEHPEKYIETFVLYGVDEVVIHFRSQKDWAKVLELTQVYELNLIVAVDVKTDLQEFLEFAKINLENINGFQVMGIEKIGFQGQKFSEKSLAIVKSIKKAFPTKQIYFDGAINDETVLDIKNSGVDVFCVGSYITKADNFDENLQNLRELLH